MAIQSATGSTRSYYSDYLATIVFSTACLEAAIDTEPAKCAF
jgi:hypothetical protein